MQNPVLDEICTTIYSDINEILLKYKNKISNKSTRDMIKAEIVAYLNHQLTRRLINVMPEVRVELEGQNAMVRFYDKETGHLIDAIDKIVKMPANWNVGKETH